MEWKQIGVLLVAVRYGSLPIPLGSGPPFWGLPFRVSTIPEYYLMIHCGSSISNPNPNPSLTLTLTLSDPRNGGPLPYHLHITLLKKVTMCRHDCILMVQGACRWLAWCLALDGLVPGTGWPVASVCTG